MHIRLFSSILAAVAITFLSFGSTEAGESPLPIGPESAPVAANHFPSPAHAVIWRNWSLVAPARIAQTLQCEAKAVSEVAEAMGLPRDPVVAPEWRRRGYITVLRRNWHLLPYDQLLTMLDMGAQELEFSLREDDFLFIKLGSSKPRCAAVRLPDRTDAIRADEARIRKVVLENFPDFHQPPTDPPFSFVKKLSAVPEGPQKPPDADWRSAPPRYIYSYFGTFGDPLLDESLDPYPDGLLARLAAEGANGVWLHVVLRQLAPGGADFPEFGEGHERRLENLRKLVNRAAARGVAVYLYINEPRAMPDAFFANHPEAAGASEAGHRAMCTSDPKVRQWLGDACAHVFKEVPGLGGVFTISGSENLTHCASHGGQARCPRCSKREVDEVTAEVNAVVAEGVHRSTPQARVLVWDWGWHNHGLAPGVISRLPKDVFLLSVSEWDQPFQRSGINGRVGEYSLSVTGPGPRALQEWKLARDAGLQTAAKVQLNCTWELAAVPWLPTLDLVAAHCQALSKVRVGALMLSWSLGGHPSPNLQVARRYFDRAGGESPEIDTVLTGIATARYGAAAAPAAREAWRRFSAAFAEYPYCGSILYQGPQHFGPSNLPSLTPSGKSATMLGFPYDDLDSWRGPYPAKVFESQFKKVVDGWAMGVEQLHKGLALARAGGAAPEQVAALDADVILARAAGLHFDSTLALARFIQSRQGWRAAALGTPERDSFKKSIQSSLEALSRQAKELHALARRDSRIGFEASNHYLYTAQDLVETVIAANALLAQLDQLER